MEVILGISGGIGAYKAAELVRGLRREGMQSTVVMTKSATRFITPLTLEVLTGRKVITDLFELPESWEVEHISLSDRADILLVAPATANIIGKFATGIADDFLSTLYLSFHKKILIAPAMNTRMYLHPVVQENIKTLRDQGVKMIDPDEGELACGTTGPGRLASLDRIIREVLALRDTGTALSGKKVVVTAGPTREYLDPVRFISNASSGKMGYAIAEEASRRGARVVLISGPTAIPLPPGVTAIRVTSAADMKEHVLSESDGTDILVMAAAVSDLTPEIYAESKIKKDQFSFQMPLKQTDDILSLLGGKAEKPFLVGFAAETEALTDGALEKLEKKNLDMIIANDVSRTDAGFGSDMNEVVIFTKSGKRYQLPLAHKKEIAARIWDHITENLDGREKMAHQ